VTGEDVRHVFEAILPRAEINRLCMQCGVIARQRKLDLGMLVRAMVISAGTPGGAYQADVLRSYLEGDVPPVARSAFYRWFDEPLERFMAALAQRAVAYAQAQQVDLSGPLCGVQDWYIVDSTTVRVRDALREEFPGTGEYAAIKVHKILSAGCGAPGATTSVPPASMTVGISRSTSPGGATVYSPTSGMPVLNASGSVKPTVCTL
jgi:hypothetical protein